MIRRWELVLVLIAFFFGWSNWSKREVKVATAEMIAPEAPLQVDLSPDAAPVLQHKDYQIEAQASYSLQARLLKKENYRFGREAELSPVDFALGWGPMSGNALLDQIKITQGNRFYQLRWDDQSLPAGVIMEHSANTHIVPATSEVASQVKAMRPGQLIELQGYLVNVTAPDGWSWKSSLTRTDTGAGACELFWVESARVVE